MKAVVLGGASSVWEDFARLEELNGGPWDGLVIAVNDIGAAFPGRIDHWLSLHPEKFHAVGGDGIGNWLVQRRANGFPGGFMLWGGLWRTGRNDIAHVDRVLPVLEMIDSGLAGAFLALHLGCDRIPLCGIRMEFGPHFFDDKPWNSPMAHREAWRNWQSALRPRVRSMGGWTAELLGETDAEWLAGPAIPPSRGPTP